MKNITALFIIAHLLIIGCSKSPIQLSTNDNSPETTAVKTAETFIRVNGYTDIPVSDTSKISFESIERSAKMDELISGRHNTLQRKAYGLLKKRKYGEKGWTVVFRYSEEMENIFPGEKTGRAVTMDENFKNLRVEHVSFMLKAVEIVLN